MRLTKFAQTLCILGVGLAQSSVVQVRSVSAADDPAATAAPESDPSQDEPFDDVLGAESAPRAKESNVTVYQWLAAKRRAPNGSPATADQPQASTLNGTIIGVNLRTSTVDVEFAGGREPTVGSQFSIHRHRVFGTEHVGRLRIVYLAGGGRAIAKPAGGTDLNRLLEGDRVSGRIVSGAGSGESDSQAADRELTTVARSHRMAPAVAEMSDTDSLSSDSANSTDEETTPAGRKVPKLVAKWARAAKKFAGKSGESMSADELDDDRPPFELSSTDNESEPQDSTDLATRTPPASLPADETETDVAPPQSLPNRSGLETRTPAHPRWAALTARSWKTLLKPIGRSPDTAALEEQTARSAAPTKSSTKGLWSIAKPAANPTKPAKQSAIVPASAELPPSILLFEDDQPTEP
ncbi:MAG TPA: hypothetical protein VHC22_34675 [Pirellulales bacterium]|nr:hypothetical protein [Pirellulales bacterium]